MTSQINEALAAGTAKAQKQISILPTPYQNLSPEARGEAEKRIIQRRVDMPRSYRRTYDRALSGNSLRAAVKAQCLECMGWQREEVRVCTAYPCPLWPYRDYTEFAVKTPVDDEILSQNQRTQAGGY
jgi:hypothetical protein